MAADVQSLDKRILDEIMSAKAEIGLESGLYKGVYASSLEGTDITENNSLSFGMLHPMLKGNLLPLYRGLEVVLREDTRCGAAVSRQRAGISRLCHEGR